MVGWAPDPSLDQTYRSVDVSLFKRLSRRWQLLGGFSATKKTSP